MQNLHMLFLDGTLCTATAFGRISVGQVVVAAFVDKSNTATLLAVMQSNPF